MSPTIKIVPVYVVLTFEALLRFGLWATLFQGEFVAAGILANAPPTAAFYYASFAVAIIFARLIRFPDQIAP